MSKRVFPSRVAKMILHSYDQGLSVAQITDKINASKTVKNSGSIYSMPSVRAAVANITRGATIRV